jgi:hypothetical protein
MAREGERSDERQWLEAAKAAYERRFGELDREPHRGLFDRIEQASVEAGMTYARLRAEAELEKQCEVEKPEACACPRCQKLCEPRSKEPRKLCTRAGPVIFRRWSFYCASCRKVFFPSGPSAGAGH